MKILIKSISCFFLIAAFAFSLSSPSVASEATLGPKTCANCHKEATATWKKTQHYKTYKALGKNKNAKAIAKKMGIKRMKSKSDCLTCHFTSKESKGKVKAIAGISCESCHGPGKEWITLHNDFGGKASEETAEHKAARFAAAESKGMLRPANLYAVGKNCFGCHTVPNEKLVNVGGHVAGSQFELVQWSQGQVKHNDSTPIERLRMMYIIGKGLDLEFALRGLAKATEDQTFSAAMTTRQQNALQDLQTVSGMLNVAEIKAIVSAVNPGDIKINNAAALTSAADKVGNATKAVASKFDGSQFAAIDSLLPAAGSYK